MYRLVLIALVATTLPEPASSQGWFVPAASPDTQRVSTQGIGEVAVPADRATALFVLHAQGADVVDVAADVAAVTDQATRALEALGLDPSSWSVVSYGAGPVAGPNRVRVPGQPVPSSAQEAKVGLRVVIDPVDRLGEVVAAVLDAGAEAVVNVVFSPREDPEVREEAARLALDDARAEAEGLAAAAGMRLGRVLLLSSTPDFVRQNVAGALIRTTLGQGVSLVPSDVTVRVTIQAVWELVPGD